MNTDSNVRNIVAFEEFRRLITAVDDSLRIFILAKGSSGSNQILINNFGSQALQLKNFTCFFIDVDKTSKMAKWMGISKFPTIFFVKNGEVKDYHVGIISGPAISKRVNDID